MSEKTLGQICEITWARADGGPVASWEAAAEAVRDAVMAKHLPEIDQLKAVIARLRSELAAKSTPQGHEWVDRDGRHRLLVLRPVEAALIITGPEFIRWGVGQHYGRIYDTSQNGLNLAKLVAEVIAGVRGTADVVSEAHRAEVARMSAEIVRLTAELDAERAARKPEADSRPGVD